MSFFSLLRIFIVLSLVVLLLVFFYFDGSEYFDLEFLIQKRQEWSLLYNSSPLFFAFVFLLFYVFFTSLSLPGASLLSLSAGFLFGFFIGTVLVCVASTVGASLSFLMSRFLLKDFVQNRFHHRLRTINKGLQKEGWLYVLSLRLVPIIPYFIINLSLGVTAIPFRQFVLASFLGMLPATLLYVNAGTQLSQITKVQEILSLPLILSFCLLAGLPWLAKFAIK